MRIRPLVLSVLVALGSVADPAPAQPARPVVLKPIERLNFPCPRCITRLPLGASSTLPMPLLVILHGDEGEPARMLRLLRTQADRRGYLLFAPACPKERGCTTASWWRWDGPPTWLSEQVQAIAATLPVDPQRIFVMGWSGGASYLSARIHDLPSLFAAVALSGGGMPAPPGVPCAVSPMPIFMVSGDRNPLRDLALSARDSLRACHHDLRFVSLSRADHAAEWLAFERTQAAAMFDFFAAPRAR